MTRHLLHLIWNRRRAHLLLGLELFVSFLILVFIGANGWYWLAESRRPVGFDYRDVWTVFLSRPNGAGQDAGWTPADSAVAQHVFHGLAGQGAVVAVAEAHCTAFSGSCSAWLEVDGRSMDYYHSFVSDDFIRVMPLDLVAGRWFGPEDNAATVEPVVMTLGMARALFGPVDPLGREFPLDKEGTSGRVIGLVSYCRPFFDMEEPAHFLFRRIRLDRPVTAQTADDVNRAPRLRTPRWLSAAPVNLVLRVKPGTPRRFEQEVVALVRAIAPGWSVSTEVLSEIRSENLHDRLEPLLANGVIGAFLLLMVCLGLTGVLWQSVTQRTREIGVRRAAGASAFRVCSQLVGEMLLLATVAVAIGAVLVAHVAALHLARGMTWVDYLAGLLAAAAVLYLLVAAASAYPGWLATRVHPAEALHYE